MAGFDCLMVCLQKKDIMTQDNVMQQQSQPSCLVPIVDAQDETIRNMWSAVQQHYPVLRFLADAMRIPKHNFHNDAWNLVDRYRSGRIGNTISTLAILGMIFEDSIETAGTDADMLKSMERVFNTMGPDWYYR